MGVVQGIDYLERNLRHFMRPARRRIALAMRLGSNRIEYQPLGVVGIISPWNNPVNLSLKPVVTAIAAGNRVMLKPSKLTPATNNRARVDVQRAVSRRTGRHGQRRRLRILLPAVRSPRLHR
jgi:acyl-CoA reductase-like NAD-dependent aldehyde dehydrogenase